MNYARIYDFRYKGVNRETKLLTWKVIAKYIDEPMQYPKILLDPAAGECEFINNMTANEKYAIDLNEIPLQYANKEVHKLIGNCLDVDLKSDYFDGIIVSHLLQNLKCQEDIARFLDKMYLHLKSGAFIAIIGPNFKYCSRNYFDFADHNLILTETRLCEHLYASKFETTLVFPKFLPLSFRGKLPINSSLVKLYLKIPLLWKFFGKQFLIVAKKP